MSNDQQVVSYDVFYLKPVKNRIKIFSEISAENRARLVKTHAERWLAANRSRLTDEQIAVVEEVVRSIKPDWYKDRESINEINPEAEALARRMEAVFSREDLRQSVTERADYISAN